MVARTVMPYTLALVVAGTIGAAAFQNQNPRPLPQNDPGRPTPPYVIVVNHGPNEAIPIAFAGPPVVSLEKGAIVQTIALPQAWIYRSVTLRPKDDAGCGAERPGVAMGGKRSA